MNIIDPLKGFDSTKVLGHFENDDYVFFWAGPFSNWHPDSFKMVIDYRIITFNCSEQAMMYLKAREFGDTEIMEKILIANNPSDQKKLGRKIKNFDEVTWVSVREKLSDQFLLEKFSQNSKLKKILLDTGDKVLVEASPVDKIWGIGMAVDDLDILDETKWRGLNLLGESLMRVRNQLRD